MRVHRYDPPFFTFSTVHTVVSTLATLNKIVFYLLVAFIAVAHLVGFRLIRSHE